MPPIAMGRVDAILVTFLAIVAGAAIPGIALTAAAQRPAMESAIESRKLGDRLEAQVRFWFSFLLLSGLSVGCLTIAKGLDWSLVTPRSNFVPNWVPTNGGAWLVGISITLLSLTVIRLRHLVEAVVDLITLGTTAHVQQSLERRRQIQNEVAREIAQRLPDTDRGALLEKPERTPRH